jgi:hypothetical protein
MAEAVSRESITAEARVQSQANPRGVYGGQNGTGSGFSPSTHTASCMRHIHSLIYHRRYIILAIALAIPALTECLRM